MSHLRTTRATLVVACVAAGTVLFAPVDSALAKKSKKKRKPAVVSRIEAPLGLAGTRGSGPDVAVPFTLKDASRRKTDIEVQFGVDTSGNGELEESEWSPATENLIDERNTRSNNKRKYSTAANIGAAQAWVWSSLLDLGSGNYPTLAIQYTDQGRVVEDPNNPGSPKFKDVQPGVRIRIRANNRKTGPGEWAVTDAFALNNNNIPSMTIDGVLPNATSSPTASDEQISILWTAFDPDSEDANGNGALDILEGEDVNLDGLPDFEKVAVAFDYHEVLPGEDPANMTPEELAALSWLPCTRAAGLGDTDAGVDSSPVGRQYTFAWDSVADVGTVNKQYILRARPFDKEEEHGEYSYLNSPFRVDNWKIFNTVGEGNLLGGRVGLTATNMTSELSQSDGSRPAPFQTFIVAGGMDESNTPSTDVTVMLVSTESADTSTANPLRDSLDTARAYHSATMLSDGRILFAGGVGSDGNPTNTTEIYDPKSRLVTPGPSLLTARSKHAAVRLTTGDVAFFGGEDANGNPLNSVEIYHFTPVDGGLDPNTLGPPMATAQSMPHAVLLPNQSVLVTGGIGASGNAVQTAELFDPLHDDDPGTPTTKNPRFTTAANSMTAGRRFGTATPLLDGNVLFAGGVSDNVTKVASATMEVFDFQTGLFNPVDPAITMPGGARAQHVAALLGDGTVVFAGGTTDPDLVTPDIIADADVFQLGAFDANSGTWGGSFLPVNGDMRIPRRNAANTVVNNGRLFVVGGQDVNGQAVATTEIFVPEGGVNLRPSARVTLASDKQSWAFGAPLNFRLSDPEQDPARVVIQFSEDSGATWAAASAQPTTIGGDVAELTANLATTTSDDGLAIDYVNNAHDHIYIWAMSADIDRPIKAGDPLPGGGTSDGTKSPFNLRVIPFGAVQGNLDVSTPVTVLFNTKVLATIWPLEDPDGTVNPNQGGDITIVSHLRDIDGNIPGSNGDVSSMLYEYAVDLNGDGLITSGANEFWIAMTPAGAPVGATAPGNSNPQTGLMTYFDAPADSDPAFGARPANKGWATFMWDSVYDLGAPVADFDGRVQMRATPSDVDEGFPTVLRNTVEGTAFNLVKHPNALFLESFTPKGGDASAVKVNEGLEFLFNGLLKASSLDNTTLKIYRNNSLVLGTFVQQQNVPTAGKTLVTFYPRAQATDSSSNIVYGEDDASTVLFPFNEYRFEIPGYNAGLDPRLGTTLRPDNAGAPTVTSTYLLVQNVPMFGDADPRYRFTTTSGHYDDGQAVAPDAAVPTNPVAGSTLANTPTLEININKALDHNTVKAPNLQVHVTDSAQTASVVPGYWRTVNTQDPITGQHTSKLTFFPHYKLPSGANLNVFSNAGLLAENGRPVMDATTSGYMDFNFSVTAYGRRSISYTETYDDQVLEDTSTGNSTFRAAWGTDPCSPNAITGLQGGGATPLGGSDVTVANGETVKWSSTLADYGNVTVQKGGTLVIDASSSPTFRILGDFVVAGLVTFKGADGYSGHAGNLSGSTYYYIGHRNTGTRKGGLGRNGGGSGGDSITGTANSGRTLGEDGEGTQGGDGGNVATFSTRYQYGGGGGAGGGHGTDGFNGGRATSRANVSSYGSQSTRGFETGDPNFGSGVTTGSGGGGGASHRYSSIYYNEGGAGGAGAGGVTFNIAGTFDLRPTGMIDGRGGNGGSKNHLGGAGGGGSGGGLHILAGQAAILDGIIDLRGGRGGPASFAYFSDYPMYVNAYVYGTNRFGGDGGLGRARIEAGNFANVDEVRVFGQLMTQKINAVPTTSISATSVPSTWGFTSGNLNLGTGSDIRYSSDLNVPSFATVNLTGTGVKRIWVDGDITIDGKVRMNGAEGTSAQYYLDYPTTIESTSSLYYTSPSHYRNHSNQAGSPTIFKGYVAQLGGGNGGDPLGNTTTSTTNHMKNRRATDGFGNSPGKHLVVSSGPGYQTGSYDYFLGQSGGGGAGNATAGTEGFAPYAVSGRYDYPGQVNASNGNGILPRNGGTPGVALDATLMTHSNINLFAGSGGAGGNSGGREYSFYSWRYFGIAGRGGAGAGAIAFIATGDIDVNGRVEARGGRGNPPGAAYPYYYSHAGGGGGSGGTVMFIGTNVNIAAASSESVTSGATIDLNGGNGGGWRNHRTGTPNQYQSYNSHGNFGGDGGHGRVLIQYSNELNNGATLLNRWGMEQSTNVYNDGMKQYRAFAGSLTYKCYGAPRGGNFRSKWFDLESINPTVNGLSMSSARMNLTLTGEGAQSHPHNPGPNNVGEPDTDASKMSGFRTISTGSLSGWRWFRWNGVFTRQSSTGLPPSADDTRFSYDTDQ